jgi:hypothetical protein
MADSMTHQEIDDFVELTLAQFEKNKIVDLSLPLQKYTFAARMYKGHEQNFRGGTRHEWKVQIANNTNWAYSGLYDKARLTRKNLMTKAYQEWSKQRDGYIYDIDEDAFQSGEETIVKEMLVLEHSMWNDIFMNMETAVWTGPASSDLIPRPINGLPHWIQKHASLGFYGGNPTGFTDGCGHLSATTYPAWKNYTGTYAQVSRDDLFDKIATAMDLCHFQPAKAYPALETTGGAGEPDWGIYTVQTLISKCRRILQAGNDNLGNNVLAHMGGVMVGSTPMTWVPALGDSASDAYDSSAPVYGLNWRTMKLMFKEGKKFQLLAPTQAPYQPTVRERHWLNWCNIECHDRRENFVFYAA